MPFLGVAGISLVVTWPFFSFKECWAWEQAEVWKSVEKPQLYGDGSSPTAVHANTHHIKLSQSVHLCQS